MTGGGPLANREGHQGEAAVTKPLSASPPLTTDGVDKMYHQPVKIHAIAAMQRARCTCWRFGLKPIG
jgi:hypothetical protein